MDAVVSANGHAVPDLTASDFEVFEDGKPRQIEAATLQPNRSTIYLLDACSNVNVWREDGVPVFNATGSSPVWDAPYLRTERAVARVLGDFIASSNRSEEKIAILSTNEGSGKLEEPGRDLGEMQHSLAGVSLPGRLQGFCMAANSPENAIQTALSHKFPKAPDLRSPDPKAGYYSRGFRINRSYILNSISQVLDAMSDIPGHKDLLVFSSGYLSPNSPERDDLMIRELASRANRAGVSIHILYLAPAPHKSDLAESVTSQGQLTAGNPGYASDARNAEIFNQGLAAARRVARLAADTGGFFSQLPDPEAGRNKRQVMADSRLGTPYDHFGVLHDYEENFLRRVHDSSVYLISYRPETPSGVFHKITLKIRRPEVTAQWRSGYYDTPVERTPVSVPAAAELAEALEKPLRGAAIRLRAMPFDHADEGPKGLRPIIDLVLSMDARDLTWTPQPNGTRQATVEATADWYGNSLLPEGTETHNCTVVAGAPDAPAQCVIELAPSAAGGFFVRAAVRDTASGRMGTAYTFAPVPEFNRDGYVTLSMPILRSASGRGGLSVDPEFTPGEEVTYDMTAYSVRRDKKTQDSRLTLRISLANSTTFEPVFLGEAVPQNAKGRGSRVQLQGRFRLPPDLVPGDYIVLFVVADTLARQEKKNVFLSNSRIAGFHVGQGFGPAR